MRLTRRVALGLWQRRPLWPKKDEEWPSRRLWLVVPSAPGGYEVYARILAPRLAELLRRWLSTTSPGANGIIGMQEVQRSQPDGYTFMFAHVGAISIGSSIYPNMPGDPVDELGSISVAVITWSGCSTRRCPCGLPRNSSPGARRNRVHWR